MAGEKYIKITRIYTGDDEISHFEDLWLPLEENTNHPCPTINGESIGFMGSLPATEVSWRVTPPGGDHDFHWSPGRALQFTLSGLLELELGDGSRRAVRPRRLVHARRARAGPGSPQSRAGAARHVERASRPGPRLVALPDPAARRPRLTTSGRGPYVEGYPHGSRDGTAAPRVEVTDGQRA
jgi:hypothetical protein